MRTPLTQQWVLDRVDQVDGHWLWTGYVNPRTGYAQSGSVGSGKGIHKVAYELWIGPVPEDVELDHAKGCPKHCVNPFELTPVHKSMNQRLIWRRRWGQMGRRDLRVARWLHNQVSEKLRETG